jgi:hypothetical protein
MSRPNARFGSCAGLVLAIGCSAAGIKVADPNGARDASGAGASGGGMPGLSADGSACGIKTFGLRMVPPDLLIVLDKSGSMNQLADGTNCYADGGFGTYVSCGPMAKWPQMATAINQVVKQTESAIRWGLATFPDDNGGCGVSAAPIVPVDNMNAANIAAAMLGDPIGGARTPTRTALVNAGTYLSSYPDGNPKYVLLATDGLPNCAPAGITMGASDEGAITAVTDLVTMGIQVFVVGIGSLPDAQATLTAMAIAGGRPQTADPRYYPVSSTAELTTVLGTIGGMIGRCSFGLGNQPPPDPTNIAVFGDGTRIPKDPGHINGWDYGTGMMSIQIYGQWCDDARSGKLKDVKAVFGCPGVVIP